MDRNLSKLMRRSCAWLEAGRKKEYCPQDPAAGPRELHFELTYSCNQRCRMCDIWPKYRQDPGLKKEELTPEEIEELVEESRLLQDLELILFSGGEPFLRPDLVRLVTFFAGKYPAAQLVILSNCFSPPLVIGKLGEILTCCPDINLMIGTSLDGLGDAHDDIRGVEGAFVKLEETIGEIKKRYPRLRVETNFTITPANAGQISAAFRYARGKGIGFSAQFPIPWEGTAENEWSPEEFKEVDREVERIMEDIYREESVAVGPPPPSLPVRLQYLKGLLDYERDPRRIFPICPAPYRYAMINPFGDVYFCPKLKEMTIGNIRRDPFDQLWRGPKAEKIRRYIYSSACHCWLNCTAYINIEKAIEAGQPGSRKFLVAAVGGLYRLYRRLLSLIIRLGVRIVQLGIYAMVFIYLLAKIGRIYCGRTMRRIGNKAPSE